MHRACADGTSVAGIGSPRASVEANFLLRTPGGYRQFCARLLCDGATPGGTCPAPATGQFREVIPDIATIESADAVLVLGEDITNTAPRIALALRQSVRNKALRYGCGQLRLETWQDAAIRNLAQDQLQSPVYCLGGKYTAG